MRTQEIKNVLCPVFEHYGKKIIFVYLFGSVAREDVAPLSDVDVAVYLSDNLMDMFFDIKLSLYADICRALRRNDVDLIVLNTTQNLMLVEEIIRNSVVLFDANPDIREEYEVKLLHRAIDFRTHRLAVMGV